MSSSASSVAGASEHGAAAESKAERLAHMTPNERIRDAAYTGVKKTYESDAAMRVATKHGLDQLPEDVRKVAKGKADPRTLDANSALTAGAVKGAIERQAEQRGTSVEKFRHPGAGSYLKTGGVLARMTGKGAKTAGKLAKDSSALSAENLGKLPQVEARPVLPTLAQKPGESAAEQIAARDRHATMLQSKLDDARPKLDAALAARDAKQVKAVGQGLGGALRGAGKLIGEKGPAYFVPGASAPELGKNYAELAHAAGHGAGRAADPGLVVSSLGNQKNAERLYPTVKDGSDQLRPIRAEQNYERDRHMIVDGEDRFYDAHTGNAEAGDTFEAGVEKAKRKANVQVPQAPSAAYVSPVPSTVYDATQRLVSGVVNRSVANDLP